MAPRTSPAAPKPAPTKLAAKAPTTPTPKKCACGGDHSAKAFAVLDEPLQEIIECSREAANPLDYHQDLSTWIAKLTPAAKKLGLTGPNFMNNVETGLEKLMREQADMQSAANATEPRDVPGGIFHGGLRGRVQEAQHQIKRAKQGLAELKKWEEQEVRRKAAKTAAKK